MFNGDFLEKMQEICSNKTHEINGKVYSRHRLDTVLPPRPDVIKLSTIGAFCEEVIRLKDRFNGVISIASPTHIKYITDYSDDDRRFTLLEAEVAFEGFHFGQHVPLEHFVVSLISLFEENEDQRQLVALLSNIVTEESIQLQDDGVSISVTKKTGIMKCKNAILSPFHALKPFRSFPEIEQPELIFLLRVRQENGAAMPALFESDGGRWRLTAVSRIYEFLKNKVADVPVIY